MAKDTRKKWKHRRVLTITAAKRDAANVETVKWGWGPDFFSIPLHEKTGLKNVKEYGADVVLTDEMLAKLQTLPPVIKNALAIEIPTTTARGSAKLKEIAAKREVEVKAKAAIIGV